MLVCCLARMILYEEATQREGDYPRGFVKGSG